MLGTEHLYNLHAHSLEMFSCICLEAVQGLLLASSLTATAPTVMYRRAFVGYVTTLLVSKLRSLECRMCVGERIWKEAFMSLSEYCLAISLKWLRKPTGSLSVDSRCHYGVLNLVPPEYKCASLLPVQFPRYVPLCVDSCDINYRLQLRSPGIWRR
jgi:hypothetical protein